LRGLQNSPCFFVYKKRLSSLLFGNNLFIEHQGVVNLEKFIISGGLQLQGTAKIDGSKNSVLPILAAAVLAEEKCVIHDVPALSDVFVMESLLIALGVKTKWNKRAKTMAINSSIIENITAPYELAQKMRASFLVTGPLLAKVGKVKMPLPGGCQIGARPVDLHIKGFAAMGAKVKSEHGYVYAYSRKLKGANIYLDFPSVGATENIMMAAATANGQTIIENSAAEPEIVDLSNFLNSLGADIRGAGTDTIKINGVKRLGGGSYTIIPDRIEAGTIMVAAAITKGDVVIENIVIDHLKPMIAKLKEAGVGVKEVKNGIRIYPNESGKLNPIDVKTMPYPGFPTDMQAQFMSLLTLAEGTSVVTETVFENRFMHVGELKRMGADIKIESRSAVVEGVNALSGAQVKATDLRAGAAILLTALAAEGETEISDIYHIDRGYYRFDDKLRSLGARIKRVKG